MAGKWNNAFANTGIDVGPTLVPPFTRRMDVVSSLVREPHYVTSKIVPSN